MRVLVFGDSVAQGFWDAEGGWVNLLRKHYDEQKVLGKDEDPPTVFNLGISGDFTSSILKRVEQETVARKYPGEEFTFIFATGINDTLYRGTDYESEPDIYGQQLKELVDIAQKYSPRVLFVGLFPVIDKLLQPAPFSSSGKSYSTERIKNFDKSLKNFCQDNNLPLVDVFSKFQEQKLEELLFDGIHPNGTGHKLIYDLVKPELEKIINQK